MRDEREGLEPTPCVGCGRPVGHYHAELPERPGGGGAGLFGRHFRFRRRICEDCLTREQRAEREREHAERLERTGVPPLFRDYTLSRVLLAREDEPIEQAARRAAQKSAPTLVIHPDNAAAYRTLRDWDWRSGRSLYLHGGVGSGKSTLAAALIGALVRQDGYPGAMFVREAELLREQRSGVRRDVHDTDPLERARKVAVLVLDDFGTTPGIRTWEVGLIEDLICARHEHRRPTVFTSNLTLEDVREGYGERLYSRIRQMTRNTVIVVGGADWRALETGELEGRPL